MWTQILSMLCSVGITVCMIGMALSIQQRRTRRRGAIIARQEELAERRALLIRSSFNPIAWPAFLYNVGQDSGALDHDLSLRSWPGNYAVQLQFTNGVVMYSEQWNGFSLEQKNQFARLNGGIRCW